LKNCLNKGFKAGKFDNKLEQVNNAFLTMKEFVDRELPRAYGDDKKQEKKSEESEKKTDDKKSEEKKPEDKKPAEETSAAEKEQQEWLEKAKKAIEDRKPEEEIAAIVIKITDKTLKKAIAKAEADAEKTAQKGKKAEYVLEQVDLLMDNLARAVYIYLEKQTTDGDKKVSDVRSQIHKLMTSYKTARHIFTHRRYEKDARANQNSAALYEVNVHLSSAKSDRHMYRSFHFMIAMLVAQVGVIIASLAMAVKQRSLVWLLATFAGIAAIGFGGYVFLGMN
jgi:hypothetical protein